MASPYTDLSRPPLRARALREALVAPAGPLARLEVVEEVGSTNAELLAAAASDPGAWPHLSVLTADSQTAGRGRAGRTWSAPPRSGLAVSVLLRPGATGAIGATGAGGAGVAGVAPERWSWLPLLAGRSVVTCLGAVAGASARLKWPNDVLLEGAKVAGVLTEVLPGGAYGAPGGGAPGDAGPAGVVVGIGLNVSLTAAELPVPTATSLALAGATSTDRDVLLRALLRTLADDVAAWVAAGGDAAGSGLADGVRGVCETLGRDVAVALPGGEEVTGVAEDLDDDGRLLLRTPGGLLALSAGDVVHLR